MYIKITDFINEIKSANITKGKDKPDRLNAERHNLAEILSLTEDEEVIFNKFLKLANKEKEPVKLKIMSSACIDLDRPDLALLFTNRLAQIESLDESLKAEEVKETTAEKWYYRLRTYEREHISKKYPITNDESLEQWYDRIYKIYKINKINKMKK